MWSFIYMQNEPEGKNHCFVVNKIQNKRNNLKSYKNRI